MSDYSNPGLAGNEPTVPLGPVDDSQPLAPAAEPTVIDPFGSPTTDYPDFSYHEPQAPFTDISTGINPEPLTTAGSYSPPPKPFEPDFVDQAPPAVPSPQYQQYPASLAPTPMPAPMAPVYPGGPYSFAQLPEHPSTIPALVLSIVGLVLMIPFASPIAWYLAARGQRDTRLQPGRWRSSGMLTASLVLGIIGTILWGLFTLLFLVAILTN